jgi:DHA1 family bicyclomycin/chloramphenicol resistance-like MFS transporter
MTSGTDAAPARSPISRGELVALLGMLSATTAISIDAMLPALPEIGAALNPLDPQRAQLVVATFVFGLGFGTLFAGPLSDAYGRRPVAVAGAVIYTLAALYAAQAQGLTELLVARAIQGIGAAGPRVIAVALIRDLYSGRQMARLASFVMIVFTLAPVMAPSLGAAIQWAFGWRAIFLAFAVFSVISMTWLLLRQPETLPPERRRPFRAGRLKAGLFEVLGNGQVVLAIAVLTLVFGLLFTTLLSCQAIFEQIFDRGESFPLWFGLMGAISASSSLLNAMVVVRIGMRRVVLAALVTQMLLSALFLGLQLTVWSGSAPAFAIAFVWILSVFYIAGLAIGNLNALALQPMGHIAGMASSVVGAISTVFGVALAVPVGQAFDGTMMPMTIGVLALSVTGVLLMQRLREPDEDLVPGPVQP